jgi:hypothetical protein
MSNVFNNIHAKWRPHSWHNFKGAFCALSTVDCEGLLVRSAKPGFEIEKNGGAAGSDVASGVDRALPFG